MVCTVCPIILLLFAFFWFKQRVPNAEYRYIPLATIKSIENHSLSIMYASCVIMHIRYPTLPRDDIIVVICDDVTTLRIRCLYYAIISTHLNGVNGCICHVAVITTTNAIYSCRLVLKIRHCLCLDDNISRVPFRIWWAVYISSEHMHSKVPSYCCSFR